MNPSKNLALHTLLSSALALVGAGLVAMMVATEGEPGALPLLILVFGLGWLGVMRWRARALRR